MRLYNCDYKNVLSEIGKVDLVITDPPYEYRDFTKGGEGGSLNDYFKNHDVLNGITDTEFNLQEFCNEIVEVMKDINIYIWCNKKQIIDYFNFFVNEKKCLYDILIWNKPDAFPTYHNKYLDSEYCLYFHNSGHCFLNLTKMPRPFIYIL